MGSQVSPAPQPISSMSLQLAIPWQVALPQSLPPLHQPIFIIVENRRAVQHNSILLSNLQHFWKTNPLGTTIERPVTFFVEATRPESIVDADHPALKSGKLINRETLAEGLDAAPAAFLDLLHSGPGTSER